MPKKPRTHVLAEEKSFTHEARGIPAAQAALLALVPEIEQLAQKSLDIFHNLLEVGKEEPEEENRLVEQWFFATLLGTIGIQQRLLEEVIPSLRETAALRESDFRDEESASQATPEKVDGKKREKKPRERPRTYAQLQADLTATRLALARHRKDWHNALKGLTRMLEDLPKVSHLLRDLDENEPVGSSENEKLIH